MEDINELNYLWTTAKDRYVVEKYREHYFIMDKTNSRMLLIEDEELHVAVVQKMIEQGNALIDLEKNQ